MKIGIASDHAGYELKTKILAKFSENKQFQFLDLGTDNAMTSVDYPDFANKLSQKIIAGEVQFGILICGSGVGISIAANRHKEIRAALCHNGEVAELSRKHNDANVLCLGARIIDEKDALKCVEKFLSTEFEGGRHTQRIKKIS